MAINPFKAGRAVGKGVRYLTQLGSKIGKSIGGGVDKLGAGTRNAQAATIKGARGVRDAASNAGAAVKRGAADARRGYNVGRSGGMHLSDLETPAQKYHHGKMASAGRANFIQANAPNRDKYIKANKLPTLNEWMATQGKGMIRNPMTMPGNKPSKGKGVTRAAYNEFAKREPGIVKQANKMRGGPIGSKNATEDEILAAATRTKMKYKNYMTNKPPVSGGVVNKPPRPPRRPSSGAGDYMSNSGGNNYKIGRRISDDQFAYGEIRKNIGRSGGMSKNRRAGIITAGSIAAGYGVHKGNEALQNHYRRQKDASRGQ